MQGIARPAVLSKGAGAQRHTAFQAAHLQRSRSCMTALPSPASASASATPAQAPAAAASAPAPPPGDGSGSGCPIDLSRVKGVLFDIDGTLTNSDPLHFQAFQDILVELGFNQGRPIDEAFFRQHISGRHNPEIAADLFPTWSEQRRVEFYEDKERRYRRLAASSLQPLAGLQDFLAWVSRRGLRKAAVTNAPRANAEMMLGSLGLDGAFEHLVLGEECTRPKPHPDPYLHAMELLGGLLPEHALIVEDSPSGVRAGAASGAPVIGLTTGQPAEALREAGAVWVVSDFRCIMEELRRQGLA